MLDDDPLTFVNQRSEALPRFLSLRSLTVGAGFLFEELSLVNSACARKSTYSRRRH